MSAPASPGAPKVYADRPEEREVYRSGDPALSDRDRLVAFAGELDELDRTWASTPLAAERAALVRRAIATMDNLATLHTAGREYLDAYDAFTKVLRYDLRTEANAAVEAASRAAFARLRALLAPVKGV